MARVRTKSPEYRAKARARQAKYRHNPLFVQKEREKQRRYYNKPENRAKATIQRRRREQIKRKQQLRSQLYVIGQIID